MIREAVREDIPRLIEMGRRFHAASPWNGIGLDEDRLSEAVDGMIASADQTILVNDALTGMVGMFRGPVFFSKDAIVAQEAFWWCESPKDALSLLQAAEEWARRIGATHCCMVRLEGLTDRLGGLYERRGYAPTEHYYLKRL